MSQKWTGLKLGSCVVVGAFGQVMMGPAQAQDRCPAVTQAELPLP